MSAMLPVLPGTLTAVTEPRATEIVPAAQVSGNKESLDKEREAQKIAREKVLGNKLVIEKPAPEEPPPEPAPEEKPPPEEPPPEEPPPEPVPVQPQEPREERKPSVRAGATRVPVLPGPAREAPEEPPPTPPATKKKPPDKRLLLTIPRLGLEDVAVGDSPKQAYLDREGIMHLSGTGFPHERGSNTYIAGHAADYDESRIPNVFRNLHTIRQGDLIALRDSSGRTYKYRVYERFVVDPDDVWVIDPIPGKKVVSLQTCFPSPTYERRLIIRGELVR